MYKYNLITPFAHSLATVSCLILLINFSLTAGAHEFEFPQCTCYEKFHRQAVRLWWYVSLSSVRSIIYELLACACASACECACACACACVYVLSCAYRMQHIPSPCNSPASSGDEYGAIILPSDYMCVLCRVCMHVCISHLRSLLGHWLRFDTDELVHKGLIWRKDVFM